MGARANVVVWSGDPLELGTRAEVVLVAGREVPVPDEIDLQYAVAAALVGRAIRAQQTDLAAQVTGRILDYARTFPQREMGVMLVSDLHRAIGEGLFQVPEFATWANTVADVMLYE